MFSKNDPVYIEGCHEYEEGLLKEKLKNALAALGYAERIRGKRVVIKPNLVRRMDPSRGGTTHPTMLSALIFLLYDLGAMSVLIAESPGGVYTPRALASVYEGCGIDKAAKKAGAELNFDCASSGLSAPNGKKSKSFQVIDPILKADLIINLCKLKSHGMLMLSCAAKNLFGVIPGVLKFEMHARFPAEEDFAGMLADLDEALYREKEILCVCDGIVGMEGNGPTGGDPVSLGVLLVSANPFNLDLAAGEIIGMKELPPLTAEAVGRGYCPEQFGQLVLLGCEPEQHRASSFRMPDSRRSSMLKKVLTVHNGRYARFFEPKPRIDKKSCRGCGVCSESCPQGTILLYTDKKGRKKARILDKRCIKCYCCQELCPFEAIRVKKNLIIRIVGSI